VLEGPAPSGLGRAEGFAVLAGGQALREQLGEDLEALAVATAGLERAGRDGIQLAGTPGADLLLEARLEQAPGDELVEVEACCRHVEVDDVAELRGCHRAASGEGVDDETAHGGGEEGGSGGHVDGHGRSSRNR
jgi:hypothetical protein